MAQSLVRVFQIGVTSSVGNNECQPNYNWNQMYKEVIQQCLEPADMLRFLSLSDAVPLKRNKITSVGTLAANEIQLSLAIGYDHDTRFRYGF
jgi:hypothetical protein